MPRKTTVLARGTGGDDGRRVLRTQRGVSVSARCERNSARQGAAAEVWGAEDMARHEVAVEAGGAEDIV